MMAAATNRRRRLAVLVASAVVLVGLATALCLTRMREEPGPAPGQAEAAAQTSQTGQADPSRGQGPPARVLAAGPAVPKLAAPEVAGAANEASSAMKVKRGTWSAEAMRERTKQSE
jgi:hypothetical protein